ncbi:MAG: ATP-binding cassette domain-containing protein [Phycisphaerae bacterium]|nr:ATP-binding cassette domain-containing protein [Phycisphaerae bacterium]
MTSDNEKPAIEVRGLAKRFDDVQAVAGIDFEVREGELFGFLGPNGAGKTTTVRMLTGVLEPTDGTASVQGHDIRTEALLSRAHMGIVPEQANVYLDLSLWQNLMLMAELHGVPRRQRVREGERLLKTLGLADRRRDKARTLSKGLRQRLMLCTALVTGPQVLFLDEPTSGLDVASARLIRQTVQELRDDGLTVFLTTHNMDEAEEMCSRVAIINQGRVVAIDTPERLRSAMRSSQYLEVAFDGDEVDLAAFERLAGVLRLTRAGKCVRLYGEHPGALATEVVRLAETTGVGITHLCTRKPSLEDVFLYFTGDHAQELEQ